MWPQVTLTFLLALTLIKAEDPPAFKRKSDKTNEDPSPKYEYKYNIFNDKESRQGKSEARDGIFASGSYYVYGRDASQNVQYVADDWGYHPYVEYKNVGPHSQTVAQIALGAQAVKALNEKDTKLTVPEITSSATKNQITIASHNSTSDGKSPEQNTRHLSDITQHQKSNLENNSIEKQEAVISNNQAPNYDNQLHQQNYAQQPEIVFLNFPTQTPIYWQPQPQFQQNLVTQQNLQQLELVPLNVELHNPNQQYAQVVQQNNDQPRALPLQSGQKETEVVYFDQNNLQRANDHQNYFILQDVQNPLLQRVTYESSTPQFQQSLLYLENQIQSNTKNGHNRHAQQGTSPRTTPTPSTDNGVQYETAALYENSGNKLIEEPGDYGSRINIKVSTSSDNNKYKNFNNLVNGQDVLNINQVFTNNFQSNNGESSTVTALVSEYPQNTTSDSKPSTTPESIINYTENYQDLDNLPPTEKLNLSRQPIIVADTTDASAYLSVELKKEKAPPESTILVTPRSLASNFLAPITAGVQLQTASQENVNHQNFVVDVQKSIPYYLGKIEYYNGENETNEKNPNITASAHRNIILGGFLQQPPDLEKSSSSFSQTLSVSENTKSQSQRHRPVGARPTGKTTMIEQPAEIINYVQNPYPRHAEKQAPITVEVEKSVEKPTTITKVIEKPIPVPYEVEKRVEVPIQVTKYVDRPYPVHVPVPSPVPYPVEKIVEKIVQRPYPVEVRVPVQVPVKVPTPVHVTVEKPVPVPQYIEKPVTIEKIVEKPVPQYIPKPYPVHIRVPVPVPQAFYVPVEVHKPYPVEVTKYINKPYAVPKPYPVQVTQTVEVPIPHPVPIEVRVPHPVPVEVPKLINKPYPIFFKNEYNLKPPKHPMSLNHDPLSYAGSYQNQFKIPCVDLHNLGVKTPYCKTINNNNYIGLVPPKVPFNFNINFNNNNNQTFGNVRKQRTAKHSFESGIRLEYGFMPPLIPSLEIDENGNPLDKSA